MIIGLCWSSNFLKYFTDIYTLIFVLEINVTSLELHFGHSIAPPSYFRDTRVGDDKGIQ